jgi:hypothetical protein
MIIRHGVKAFGRDPGMLLEILTREPEGTWVLSQLRQARNEPPAWRASGTPADRRGV